jgi:pyruvate/2-oxoglutarate dehydrogenase complex dihydrolipoamide dehydrogenase (E3) component
MAVDYDLVIIGSSPAGIQAARRAAQLHARVALIDPVLLNPVLLDPLRTAPVSLPCTPAPALPIPCAQWHAAVTAVLGELQAPKVLAAQGIEVLAGPVEFFRKPHLGVRVNGRSLRSRAYLLATAAIPQIPSIPGIDAIPYFTVATIAPHLDTFTPEHRVVVVGGDPRGLEIAQALIRQKVQVTVIVASATILPDEDAAAVALLQAQLEADGIVLLTATAVTQMRQIADQVWVQAGNQAIAADAILLAPGHQPNLAKLNLEAAGVKWDPQGLPVNAHLQTTNPRIYACLGQWGSDYLEHLALQQAQIAVDNALFWPTKTVNLRAIPRMVQTAPEFLTVGLSTAQAQQRYRDVMILRQPLNTLAKAQWQGTTTGFCQLVVRRNGDILGAQVVGPAASELGGVIILAMQQNLRVQALATLALPLLTFAQIIPSTALEWQRLSRLQQPWRRDWLEEFWSWRRSL